ETHHGHSGKEMGFAALNPSYGLPAAKRWVSQELNPSYELEEAARNVLGTFSAYALKIAPPPQMGVVGPGIDKGTSASRARRRWSRRRIWGAALRRSGNGREKL